MGEYVRVLGPLAVEGSSDAAGSGSLGPTQRRLLAMLCAEPGSVVSVDRLRDGLDVSSDASVRSAVSRMRALVGEAVRQVAPGYLIDSGAVDSQRFIDLIAEAAAAEPTAAIALYDAALSLWRGSAFEEFADEEWVMAAAVWLDEARATAREDRVAALVETGQFGGAASDAERLAAEFPLRERPRGLLMRSLAADGRRTEALRVFNDFSRFLNEEVGVEPSGELRSLEQSIAAGELTSAESVHSGRKGADTVASGMPSGVVTFLFTDVEGSTRLWGTDSEAMSASLTVHDRLLEKTIESHGGYVFTRAGDSFAAAFRLSSDAVAAASECQDALEAVEWPGPSLSVRMGLHLGEAEERDRDYFGSVVNTAARVEAAAHGGQVLLTEAVRQAADMDARFLGQHRLTDLHEPVRMFQLGEHDFPALRTVSVGTDSLPRPRTSLIGNASFVDEVRKLLTEVRLVTIAGVGGCGKTRLAIEVAHNEVPSHPQGVWFIDLAAIADEPAVAGAFSAALDLSTDSHSPAADQIATYLAPRNAVLVVDNCEHVIDEVADLLDTILGRAPDLRILATSREPLEIDGEHTWRIPSLATGPDEAAVRLFIDRAASTTGSFDPDEEAAGVIAEICEQLDGIPLAIELAATRTRTMSATQLRDNLDDRFKLFSGGGRRSRQRRQTLDATVRWSYDLLSTDEQMMLRQLSVFRGGFDLDDVAAVAGMSLSSAIDLVDGLVAKSMVSVKRIHGEVTRHYLLETIRLFAKQELINLDSHDEVRTALLDHFLSDPRLWDWGTWSTNDGQTRIERELENLRAAVSWALECNRPEAVVMLACAIYDALTARGELAEVLAWLDQPTALERELDVKRLTIASHLRLQQFDVEGASSTARRAIELAGSEAFDLVLFAYSIEARALFLLGDITAVARSHDAMAAIAPETSSPTISAALTRLTEVFRAFTEHDLSALMLAADAGITEAPDFHARDLFALLRDAARVLQGDGIAGLPSIDDPARSQPSYTTPWSYLHIMVPILESIRTVGPSSAAIALAEAAPEIVARQPTVVGEWVMAFGFIHAELGDFDRANELIDGAVANFLYAIHTAVRARQSLPPDLDSLVTGILARFAKQPQLFQEEIEHWTAVAKAEQASA